MKKFNLFLILSLTYQLGYSQIQDYNITLRRNFDVNPRTYRVVTNTIGTYTTVDVIDNNIYYNDRNPFVTTGYDNHRKQESLRPLHLDLNDILYKSLETPKEDKKKEHPYDVLNLRYDMKKDVLNLFNNY